VARVILEQKQH